MDIQSVKDQLLKKEKENEKLKKTVNKNEINILKVVSDNPKILNVTSLQLTLFSCNCFKISSFDNKFDPLFRSQTNDS